MKKIIVVFLATACMISCSVDNSDTQSTKLDNNTPAVADLISFIPGTEFDSTAKGKYVGVFGHHLNKELHGKIYINAGVDGRYAALIQLVSGKELRFTGKQHDKSNPDHIYFEGKSGSFDINFTNYSDPEISNVLINNTATEAYIVLTKVRGGSPFIMIGSYVDESDGTFFGNWDLITNPLTNTSTAVVLEGISGTATTQEIVTMSISHTDFTDPFIVDGPDDFDENIATACVPGGFTIPTLEPVIVDFIVPFVGTIGGAVSAGGQTSTINGKVVSWSLNYATSFPIFGIPESYAGNDCSPVASGTWSWNGRTGSITVF